jgi:hypothetical protein
LGIAASIGFGEFISTRFLLDISFDDFFYQEKNATHKFSTAGKCQSQYVSDKLTFDFLARSFCFLSWYFETPLSASLPSSTIEAFGMLALILSTDKQ